MTSVAPATPHPGIKPQTAASRESTVRAIYVDCTHVLQTQSRSGIPRVVRNLAILGSQMSEGAGIPVRAIVLTSRGLATIPAEWLLPRPARGPSLLFRRVALMALAFWGAVAGGIAFLLFVTAQSIAWLRSRLRKLAKRTIGWLQRTLPSSTVMNARWLALSVLRRLSKHGARESRLYWFWDPVRIALDRTVYFCSLVISGCTTAIRGVARFSIRALRFLVRRARAFLAVIRREFLAFRLRNHHVRLDSGDVLLLADSNWQVDQLWVHVQQIRSRGGIVGSVMYDLIPLRRPDFVGDQLCRIFTKHLLRVTEHNDFIIGISRDTSRDFLEFAVTSGFRGWNTDRAGTFRLGGDRWTKSTAPCSVACRDVVNRVKAIPTYLIVGTFEIRKNHKAALDAFDQLWREGHNACLLILGRPGYRADDQMARVRSHPEWGKRLFWAANASDGDLEAWYEVSRAVIMPSFAEGFGLPIAEAMARGKSVFASGIPAHREIAEGFCEFFDPARPRELTDLLRADLRGYRNPGLRPVCEFVWPDWPESVRECLTGCARMAALGPR